MLIVIIRIADIVKRDEYNSKGKYKQGTKIVNQKKEVKKKRKYLNKQKKIE